MRRVALVTGAARGIGRAIAEALRQVDVTVVGLDLDHADETPWLDDPRCVDVSQSDAVAAVVEDVVAAHGGLDIVVCAAGITRDRVSWKMPDRDWLDVIDVNLTGVFNAMRPAIPALRRSPGGRAVFISSINGLRGRFGQANYAAAKAGLIGLARTLALELARDGVTVNVVAPGYIDTDMTRALPEDLRVRAVERTPLRRMGTVADVASLVRFLASDEASFITGAVIPVDGGQILGHAA